MKKLQLIVGAVIMAAVINVQAQLTTTMPVKRTLTASGKTKFLAFEQSQLANVNEVTIAVYPTYAPDVDENWGGGVALLYAVAPDTLNNHVYTGLRLDYIGGGFFAPSVTLGLKADVQILGHNVTPFVIGGAIVPLSDRSTTPEQDESVGAIAGTGFTACVWASESGKASFNLFAAVEKWTIFDGEIYHGGAAFNLKF